MTADLSEGQAFMQVKGQDPFYCYSGRA
jgi:hypothetical protein